VVRSYSVLALLSTPSTHTVACITKSLFCQPRYRTWILPFFFSSSDTGTNPFCEKGGHSMMRLLG